MQHRFLNFHSLLPLRPLLNTGQQVDFLCPFLHLLDVEYCVFFTFLYIFQEHAVNSEHIWMDTNASGDFCYAVEQDCIVSYSVSAAAFSLSLVP